MEYKAKCQSALYYYQLRYLVLLITFAYCLSQVSVLDVDLCGPSIPRMLGVEGHEVHQSAHGLAPFLETVS